MMQSRGKKATFPRASSMIEHYDRDESWGRVLKHRDKFFELAALEVRYRQKMDRVAGDPALAFSSKPRVRIGESIRGQVRSC
jgi:hypothetical protein